ncbi:MAG: type II toxin-antitoxin system RelE/ParE family toxin, partial [Leptospirillia bacterium]
MKVAFYVGPDGLVPFQEWFRGLLDKRAKTAIVRRLDRLKSGNPGDHKFCREGIWEIRIDVGPGYRVYYTQTDPQEVLLFTGGKKDPRKRTLPSP